MHECHSTITQARCLLSDYPGWSDSEWNQNASETTGRVLEEHWIQDLKNVDKGHYNVLYASLIEILYPQVCGNWQYDKGTTHMAKQ